MKKNQFVALLLCSIFIVSIAGTYYFAGDTVPHSKKAADSGNDVRVVASFYPVYIAAMNLLDGVEGVKLFNLSEPNTGCLHDYELTPGDMKLLDSADIFVINGGGLEPFTEDVEKIDGLKVIDSSEGLIDDEDHDEGRHDDAGDEHEHDEADSEHEHGHHHDHGVNAHLWMSPTLYRGQTENMARRLKACLPKKEQRDRIDKNLEAYVRQIDGLIKSEDSLKKDFMGEKVIIFHEAYEYLADELGMEISFLLDLDEEREVSANEIKSVLDSVTEGGAGMILAEENYGRRTAEAIKKEAEVSVLYLDVINRGEGDNAYSKDSYIRRMDKNLRLLKEAK